MFHSRELLLSPSRWTYVLVFILFSLFCCCSSITFVYRLDGWIYRATALSFPNQEQEEERQEKGWPKQIFHFLLQGLDFSSSSFLCILYDTSGKEEESLHCTFQENETGITTGTVSISSQDDASGEEEDWDDFGTEEKDDSPAIYCWYSYAGDSEGSRTMCLDFIRTEEE